MLSKTVRSVLNKLKQRDDWFQVEYTANPYEGCSCNCLYCYIRGSKYEENMAEKLSAKSNALEILNKQLKNRAAKGQYGFVAYTQQHIQSVMSTAALKAIQQELRARGKPEAKDFFNKMVPGAQTIYGVKTPVLNELAKQYKEHGFELAEALWNSGALEEKIIAVKIVEKMGKKDPERLLKLVQHFAEGIDNWAVCDAVGMQSLRSIVKTHREAIFKLAFRYNRSPDLWKRRLSLVMVEWYTREPSAHAEINKLVKALEKDKEYYANKAVDWIKRNLVKGK